MPQAKSSEFPVNTSSQGPRSGQHSQGLDELLNRAQALVNASGPRPSPAGSPAPRPGPRSDSGPVNTLPILLGVAIVLLVVAAIVSRFANQQPQGVRANAPVPHRAGTRMAGEARSPQTSVPRHRPKPAPKVTPSRRDTPRYLAQGVEHFKAREYDKAGQNFMEAIRLEPKSQRAHLWLGTTYARQGRMPLAASQLKKVIELDPTTSDAETARRLLQRLGFRGPSRPDVGQNTHESSAAAGEGWERRPPEERTAQAVEPLTQPRIETSAPRAEEARATPPLPMDRTAEPAHVSGGEGALRTPEVLANSELSVRSVAIERQPRFADADGSRPVTQRAFRSFDPLVPALAPPQQW